MAREEVLLFCVSFDLFLLLLYSKPLTSFPTSRSIFAATVFLVVWATIYESILESRGFVLKEIEKQASSDASSKTKRRLKEGETCEMNHMNNNNNEINFDPDDDSSLRETRTLGKFTCLNRNDLTI